jgi:hypothetical protein
MTKKCKEARENILHLCDIYINTRTNEAYKKYIQAVVDFEYRFKKRFDPRNLTDDYLDDYEAVKLYQKYCI